MTLSDVAAADRFVDLAGLLESCEVDGFRATLTSISPRTRPASADELDRALAALRWERADLDDGLPPHVTNAGVTHLILAARTHARLAALDYDVDTLGALMSELDWTTLQLVFRERPDLFHARNPFPPGGIFEPRDDV